jgi:hypothetical protein
VRWRADPKPFPCLTNRSLPGHDRHRPCVGWRSRRRRPDAAAIPGGLRSDTANRAGCAGQGVTARDDSGIGRSGCRRRHGLRERALRESRTAPFLQPSTGRVAGVTEGRPETVADGLTLPTMARIGPDGVLYVSNFSVYADGGEGEILRVDIGGE